MTQTISAIVPIYNREKYIGKCLDSIISQTYKNIEIICIDDCSNDNSLEMLRRYEANDSRIKTIALKKNSGVSNARNVGIENATGDFLAFIDSDDTIDKNMFSEMLKIANKTEADIILSDLDMFNGNKKQNMKISLEPFKLYSQNEIKNDILPRFTYEGNDNLGLFAFSTKLYRRDIIIKNNIRFDTSIAYEEDKLFVIEVFANCNSLYYIPKAYYKYDTSSGGLYSAFNKNAWHWYVNGYKKFNELINKYKIENAKKEYLANSFIYNISWFLYRSSRINNSRERRKTQKKVVKSSDVIGICNDIVSTLSSFDKLIAKFIISGNTFLSIRLIDFIYSGRKDKLFKIIKRQ